MKVKVWVFLILVLCLESNCTSVIVTNREKNQRVDSLLSVKSRNEKDTMCTNFYRLLKENWRYDSVSKLYNINQKAASKLFYDDLYQPCIEELDTNSCKIFLGNPSSIGSIELLYYTSLGCYSTELERRCNYICVSFNKTGKVTKIAICSFGGVN